MKTQMTRPEKFLYYFLSATIFVDFINGIFITLPLGEVYRATILVVSFFFIFKNKIKETGYILLMLFYFLTISFLTYTQTVSLYGLQFDLKMVLKAIYFVVIFKVIKSLYNANKFKMETLKKIILNNLYYTPFLFLFAKVLGVGKTSYENVDLGFKGTFMSLNSINIAMIVLYIFAIDGLFNGKKKMKSLFLTISVIIPMVLLGTKSSLIFLAFAPMLYLLLNFNFKVQFTLKKVVIYYWTFFLTFIAGLLLYSLDVNASVSYIDNLIMRQQYLFENRDLVTYFLSGRNWLLESGSLVFMQDIGILKILFGAGYFNLHNGIAMIWGQELNAVRPIEMDIFDIFFSYGTVGVVMTYGYFLRYLLKGFYNATEKIAQPYFVALVSLLIFSVVGGHVFLEAISSTFLGLCLAGWYIAGKELKPTG